MKFLKPDWKKFVIFIVVFLTFPSIEYLALIESRYLEITQPFLYIRILISAIRNEYYFGKGFFIGLTINIITFYFISCIIAHILNKVKDKWKK